MPRLFWPETWGLRKETTIDVEKETSNQHVNWLSQTSNEINGQAKLRAGLDLRNGSHKKGDEAILSCQVVDTYLKIVALFL